MTGYHKNYPAALERAARTFRKDPRYKNDSRFVKIWVAVAQRAKIPEEVFKYLAVNEIGGQTAVFYEEYATYLESVGRCVCVCFCFVFYFIFWRMYFIIVDLVECLFFESRILGDFQF